MKQYSTRYDCLKNEIKIKCRIIFIFGKNCNFGILVVRFLLQWKIQIYHQSLSLLASQVKVEVVCDKSAPGINILRRSLSFTSYSWLVLVSIFCRNFKVKFNWVQNYCLPPNWQSWSSNQNLDILYFLELDY